MSPEDVRKKKSHPQQKSGLRRTLEGVLEHLREELDGLVEGLLPPQPQPIPIPIPVPVRRPRRR